MSKSTVPVEHGFANPFLYKAANLIANAAEYRELAQRIQQTSRQLRAQGRGSREQLLKQLSESGVKQQLRRLFEQHQEVGETPPVLGAPPRPNEVYGRFGRGLKVVDVGSGNGSKLKKFSGVLKITAIEPTVTMAAMTVNVFKGDFASYLMSTFYDPEQIFTSFMSVCQLPPPQQADLFKHDGLHLVPDHELLLQIGVARWRDDKVVVRTPRRHYSDHFLTSCGFPVEPGYSLISTFAPREINITLGPYVPQEYKPVIDASPAAFVQFDLLDVSWKWDGVACELEISDSVAFMVNRAGMQAKGSTNFPYHLCLHLEQLEGCFALIRVVSYRGFIPPHCGHTLREFADKVRIFIDGKPVCGPPQWRPGIPPRLVSNRTRLKDRQEFEPGTDGLISRKRGFDYYCKYRWTVDVRDTDMRKLASRLADNGMEMTVIGETAGLCEYGVDREGSIVKFSFLRVREDKVKATSLDTVMYMLQLPTLEEMSVLE